MKNIDKDKIDYLFFAQILQTIFFRQMLAYFKDKLGLRQNIGALDIILACSGYVYTLGVAKSLILSGQAKNILLITSDVYSKFIKKDYKNRILFGDGSTSTLISKDKDINSFKIGNFTYGTDGSGHKNAIIDNFGSRHWLSKKKVEKL